MLRVAPRLRRATDVSRPDSLLVPERYGGLVKSWTVVGGLRPPDRS